MEFNSFCILYQIQNQMSTDFLREREREIEKKIYDISLDILSYI